MKQTKNIKQGHLLGVAFSSLLLMGPVSARNHKVAAGDYHSLANQSNGTVWAWGNNNIGQLGDNTFVDQPAPVQSGTIDKVISVDAGVYHSMALKYDGTVWTWGYNDRGPLGDGTNTDSGTPVQVSGLTGAVAIAAGYEYSLALKSDGTVWSWGDNTGGQLGNGTYTDSNVPVQVTGLTNVVDVSGGNYHSLAVKSDGTVWAWGYNSYGHLGDGTTTDQLTPVQVTGLSNVVAVAAGNYYSLALKNDGTVWAWGVNIFGALGDGTNTDSNTPVQVSGLTNVVSIACGHDYGVAVKSDGTGWAWGQNHIGQLGDGTTTNTNSPVQISGLTGALEISAGQWHTVALKSDGTVQAWGYNGYGALGDNSYVDSLTPVVVSGLTGIGPFSLDTDGDGLTDDVDPTPTVHSFLAAWNADTASPIGSVFASYGFTQVPGTPLGAIVSDGSGNTRHATARNISKFATGVLTNNSNGIATYGFDCAGLYHFSIDTKSPVLNIGTVETISAWVYFPVGSLASQQPIFSYVPYQAQRGVYSAAVENTIRAMFQTTGGTLEFVFRNWMADTLATSIRERWTLDRNAAQLEGAWHHLAFVWQGTGGAGQNVHWGFYLDGRKQTRTLGAIRPLTYYSLGQDTFVFGANATGGTGANATFGSSFAGKFDRVRLFTNDLSSSSVNQLYKQDTDGDGIWDIVESNAGGTRPYTWNPPSTDTDGDGRTDIYEQANGTNPNVFD